MPHTKVIVIQADNRPTLDFLLLTKQVNMNACKLLKYKYRFININDNILVHPATYKINVMNKLLNNTREHIVVFLDSDAWIQNGGWLQQIINNLVSDKFKHGCFSRDPYLPINSYINSGSFILKINKYTQAMYKNLIYTLYTDELNSEFRNKWPYDQFYISNYVFNNRKDFIIFKPCIMNTPGGKVLRHNWWKNERMFDELNTLINSPPILDTTSFIFNKLNIFLPS